MAKTKKSKKTPKTKARLGRPKDFETAKELYDECEDYFKIRDEQRMYKYDAIRQGQRAGEILEIPLAVPYSLASLQLHLGITDQTWRNYRERKGQGITPDFDYDFFGVITYVEQRISDQKRAGATTGIFKENIIAREEGLEEKARVHIEQPIFGPQKD